MSITFKITKNLTTNKESEEPLYDPEIVSFFNKVRAKRRFLEMSQVEMAKKMGMSLGNWQRKESGRSKRLPILLIEQISKVLGCTVDELKGSEVTGNANFWDKSRAFRRKYNIPQSAMAELMGISLQGYISKEVTPPRKEYYIPHVTTDDKEYNALSKRTREYVDSYPDNLRPKVDKAKAHNDVREMAIEFLEMCIGNYANDKITRHDHTVYIPSLVERGVVEEISKGIYRLTEKFAEPM